MEKSFSYYAYEARKQGNIQEAIDLYRRALEEENSAPAHTNLALAYMDGNQFELAIEQLQKTVALSGQLFASSSEWELIGVCRWWLNKSDDAVKAWQKASTTAYTDAAGGIIPIALAIYGAFRSGDIKTQEKNLKKLSRFRIKSQNWPNSIKSILLTRDDELSYQKVLSEPKSEMLRSRWKCQADFYFGLRHLLLNNPQDAQRYFERSANNRFGLLEAERYLAKWEVKYYPLKTT